MPGIVGEEDRKELPMLDRDKEEVCVRQMASGRGTSMDGDSGGRLAAGVAGVRIVIARGRNKNWP